MSEWPTGTKWRRRLPLPAHLDNTQESKRARVMKLRREGAVNERVADRNEVEAPTPSSGTS